MDNGRTVRSLAYLLAKYDRVKLFFVAPDEMQIKPDILEYLDKRNVSYTLANSTKGILSKVDVVYQTRIDKEKLKSQNVDFSHYNIDKHVLQIMKYDSIIMHPLPRSVEINSDVDKDPRAAYFRQTQNGLFVRMAILSMLFDEN